MQVVHHYVTRHDARGACCSERAVVSKFGADSLTWCRRFRSGAHPRADDSLVQPALRATRRCARPYRMGCSQPCNQRTEVQVQNVSMMRSHCRCCVHIADEALDRFSARYRHLRYIRSAQEKRLVALAPPHTATDSEGALASSNRSHPPPDRPCIDFAHAQLSINTSVRPTSTVTRKIASPAVSTQLQLRLIF